MKTILLAKIITTVILWAVPLLFGTPELFSYVGIPFPAPAIFMRLLGMAYFTLVFVYYNAYKMIKKRKNITGSEAAISAGIVSNGLAFIVLFTGGLKGDWNNWGTAAQVYMWLSTFLTFVFSAALQITFKRLSRKF